MKAPYYWADRLLAFMDEYRDETQFHDEVLTAFGSLVFGMFFAQYYPQLLDEIWKDLDIPEQVWAEFEHNAHRLADDDCSCLRERKTLTENLFKSTKLT